MPNYQNGKIYKIISQHTDKCYVGSTTLKYLSSRLTEHKYVYKTNRPGTSKYILELGDYEIVLLELCPCNSKDELHKRERHYIDILDCINKLKPCRSKEELKQYRIQYNLDNKDKMAIQKKNWAELNKDKLAIDGKKFRELHKDKIAIQKKNYRELHKEKNKAYHKDYYINNKEAIIKNHKVKITCDCGVEVCKNNLPRHIRSQKHINLINN